MGAAAHVLLGCVYTFCFIIAWRSLKAGELNRSATFGIVGALALAGDLGLYFAGVGLFS